MSLVTDSRGKVRNSFHVHRLGNRPFPRPRNSTAQAEYEASVPRQHGESTLDVLSRWKPSLDATLLAASTKSTGNKSFTHGSHSWLDRVGARAGPPRALSVLETALLRTARQDPRSTESVCDPSWLVRNAVRLQHVGAHQRSAGSAVGPERSAERIGQATFWATKLAIRCCPRS